MNTLTETVQKLNLRLEKFKENLQDEIQKQGEEVFKRIDEVDATVIANDEKAQNKYDRLEKALDSEVAKLREYFEERLENDLKQLHNIVTNSTQQAQE